jgi:hypothetical protein
MRELYIFCEGQTEQGFCSRVLQPHFFPEHDGRVHSVRIAHSRRKGVICRGGVNNYQIIKNDILRFFRAHTRPNVLFTTLIDLYALPNDFPGKASNVRNPNNPRPYVESLELALTNDLNENRFIPHLQLHEFETLIFAEPDVLKLSYQGIDAGVEILKQIASEVGDIEKINDSPQSAPSKRIINYIPQYEHDKTTVGPDAVESIGMEKLIECCEHFAGWISSVIHRLEAL